ncbi:[PSI+] inducibility protein 3 [Monosporozyma unispora]|nr:protein that induces appearance of [PIN+] prion when overproduced [Kazachstania unispora]
MSSALINRALTNVRTELDFLRESNVISEDVYNNILDQIPIKYDPSQSRESVSSRSNTEYVEAIYEFEPQQGGDLHIRPGDKIEVLEKPSPEWYKGKCNGETGMFPSNYVKPAFSGSSAVVKSQPPQYDAPEEKYSQQQYQAPPPQQYQAPPQQHYQPPYPPASTGYYQQPQQQPQQVIVQQEQPQNTGSSQMKKFGSKLGNAAIFGAGATLGSDLVNSIF